MHNFAVKVRYRLKCSCSAINVYITMYCHFYVFFFAELRGNSYNGDINLDIHKSNFP